MIKSDINLLPKKKRLPASVSFGIPLGIGILVFVLALGIIIPRVALSSKQNKLDALEQELATYSNTESDYAKKIAEFTKLQNQQTTYMKFTANKQQTLDILNKINAVKPATVTLSELRFDYEVVSLFATAPNDTEIARFEVALRKLAIFTNIQLGTIKSPALREFDISLVHKDPELIPTGGAGK
ncbi:MAG: PilN domain-containing protein [Saccharofermentanales bacterium]